MALHDDVLALRNQRIKAGQPPVPESLQGVTKAKVAEVLGAVALGGNADIVDGVFALLDDETPSWFAKAPAGAKVADGATTAHLACHIGILQRGNGKAMLQVKVNLPEHPGGAWRFNTERIEVGTDAEYGTPIPATRAVWDELDHTLTPKTAVGPARGPKSKSELPFAIWVKAVFTTPGGWLRVDHAMATAMRDGACPSESWWNKHSGEYLDKQNMNGTWWCRPKDGGVPAQG